MKNVFNPINKSSFCLCVIFLLLLSSCKKEEFKAVDLASFTVVNVVGSLSVKADFTGKTDFFTNTEIQTDFNRQTRFVTPVNQVVPVTVVSSFDPKSVLFSKLITFAPGDIYSLFLVGEINAIDTILIKENIPILNDRFVKIRFINGSPTVGELKIVPIRIDTSGVETSETPITGLNYKSVTDFFDYQASGAAALYRFEIRDNITDDLVYSFNWQSLIPRQAFTFVLRGSVGGTPAFGRFTMANSR